MVTKQYNMVMGFLKNVKPTSVGITFSKTGSSFFSTMVPDGYVMGIWVAQKILMQKLHAIGQALKAS
jgi:ABC-type uncharacterized transport system fused permease/ATPase subunit